MSRTPTPLIALAAASTLAAPALAQPTITWSTTDCGGGTSTGGGYTLSGTVGQPDAGAPQTGGGFVLVGGFWGGADAGACPADWNGDGTPNSTDISAFLTSWLNSLGDMTLTADFNGDQTVNSADISAFLSAWLLAIQQGC